LLAGGWTENQLHEFAWPVVVHAYAVERSGSERLVQHHVRHSPTGFEFGYHGSGPAELARCLLLDYFDLHEQPDDVPLPVSYQQFKRDFIGRLSRDTREHAIDLETIDTWIGAQSAIRRRPTPDPNAPERVTSTPGRPGAGTFSRASNNHREERSDAQP